MKAFHHLLQMPEHIQPFSMVVLGYAADEPKQPKDRFKEHKIHNNMW